MEHDDLPTDLADSARRRTDGFGNHLRKIFGLQSLNLIKMAAQPLDFGANKELSAAITNETRL